MAGHQVARSHDRDLADGGDLGYRVRDTAEGRQQIAEAIAEFKTACHEHGIAWQPQIPPEATA